LDIKDAFGVDGNNTFVAGYFRPDDLLFDIPFSNKRDMIYIDTNPGLQQGLTHIYNTIAHEVQHLMNFVFSGWVRRSRMDLWIDEGLSMAAEWIWNREHSELNWRWFNEDPTGLITKGNNFFVWGNHAHTNPSAVLDDYSTAYLFFQWLRLQADGDTGIYEAIIHSRYPDFMAVTTAANIAMPDRGYNDWSTLLRTWLAANYINAPTGPYGYRNDPTLRQIRANYLTGNTNTFPLFPGEGVFTQKTSIPSETTVIRYAGLPTRGSLEEPNLTSASESSALLSFNISTDTRTNALSSLSVPFSAETTFSEEILTRRMSTLYSRQSLLSTPHAIGAGDLLRMNGHEERSFNFDFSKFRQMVNIGE
jgi:hypothetical protein